ncbi:MAG TPA: glutathione S-transferase C-terminal domain-containing protein, partial [Burkholderiales bacterium]
DYFEGVLVRAGGRWMVGGALSYVDLSMFQVVAGLRYAFPRAMARLAPAYPLLTALHQRVAVRPRVAAYLKSKRRLPFNKQGLFRRYPELDAK